MSSARLSILILVCLLASFAGAQTITSAYPAVIGFVDLSTAGGTAITTAGDDTAHTITTTVGNAYFAAGSVTIGNNGAVIAVPGGAVVYTNADIVGNSLPVGLSTGAGILMPFWDDLFPGAGGAGGTIYWKETAGVLYIMWKGEQHYNAPNPLLGEEITFEVQVFSNPLPCTPAVQFLYPDPVFGGSQAIADNGASATIGYAPGSLTGISSAKWSYNAASIGAGTVLTILGGATSLTATSPFGSGTLQLNIADGTCLATSYVMPVTLNIGAFPYGWLYGVDIPFPELTVELNTGFPFKAPISGSLTIGPFYGLPPNVITFTAVAILLNSGGVPIAHSNAISYLIP